MVGRRNIISNQIKTSLAQLSNAYKQHELVKRYRKATRKMKPSVIAVYVSIFALVIVMVFIGYRQPQDSTTVANATNLNSSNQTNQTSVDNIVATSVAANVARLTNLPIAPDIANLAISTKTQSEFDQSIIMNEAKPQIIVSGNTNRSITSYTVIEGDNVDTLAAKFGVSKETIKWANDLIYDSLSVGKVLQILPVDGVLYNVKSGDTVDSLADRYGVDKTRLVLYNDLDVSGLVVGSKIILPSATLPNTERPGYVAPVVYYYAGQGTGFGGDTWNISYGTGSCPTYGYGQCTCYAYYRRTQLGLTVGGQWGNASSWAYNARLSGLAVDNTPSVGAIIQNGGGAGHVAIVDSISSNGDLKISEMNAYVSGGGWNVVSGRNVPSGNVSQYLYIH